MSKTKSEIASRATPAKAFDPIDELPDSIDLVSIFLGQAPCVMRLPRGAPRRYSTIVSEELSIRQEGQLLLTGREQGSGATPTYALMIGWKHTVFSERNPTRTHLLSCSDPPYFKAAWCGGSRRLMTYLLMDHVTLRSYEFTGISNASSVHPPVALATCQAV